MSSRRDALESSSAAFFPLRCWIRSESFSSEESVRMLVPLAVLALVTKISPARANTAAVSTRTGCLKGRRTGPWGESAELLNVPLSPSAPRKHYANGRPGEAAFPLAPRRQP